ncbi:MAG: NGG1p interacting factor NIF3 [Candidatus Omnitrophica bacterium]|nr:NGG1p interacting factor NIF3 [Candidatus Omnitrophota bacterium]
MNLEGFYKEAIFLGASCDVRKDKGKRKVFPDSAILYGNPKKDIKKILVGIDIGVAELLLAEKIRQRNGLDLVISHHPQGKAFCSLPEVMRLQADILVKTGFPRKVAEEFLDERIREVERGIISVNHMRSVDAARLLDIPFICLHTPADNQVADYLQKLFLKKKPYCVQDIVDTLLDIPEYKIAAREVGNGPKVILGNPRRRAGKVLLEMTGGTEGPKGVYGKLYKQGVRTLVSMHLSEGHFKKAKDINLNAVIAGHISSDNLGLNLLLDRIEKKAGEKFYILDCSGFRRISRI